MKSFSHIIVIISIPISQTWRRIQSRKLTTKYANMAVATTLHLKRVEGASTDDIGYVNTLPSQMNVGMDDVYLSSFSVLQDIQDGM